jgi:hypothetical protein
MIASESPIGRMSRNCSSSSAIDGVKWYLIQHKYGIVGTAITKELLQNKARIIITSKLHSVAANKSIKVI